MCCSAVRPAYRVGKPALNAISVNTAAVAEGAPVTEATAKKLLALTGDRNKNKSLHVC